MSSAMSTQTHHADSLEMPNTVRDMLAEGLTMDDLEEVAFHLGNMWTNNGVTLTRKTTKEGHEAGIFKMASVHTVKLVSKKNSNEILFETTQPDNEHRTFGAFNSLNRAVAKTADYITTINL
jgi:hypothetical protein